MSLTKLTIENIGYVYISMMLTKAFGLVGTVILARLLLPSDFGLVVLSGFFVGIIGIFSDFGIGAALIQKRDHIEDAANVAFYTHIATGVVLYTIAFFIAPFGAHFFNEAVITQIIRISALGLIIGSFGLTQEWLLYKELKYQKITIIQVISSIAFTISTITFAFFGFSFWSLVYGSLISGFIGVISLWFISPWRPKLSFDKKVALDLLDFGKFATANSIINFLFINVDNVAAGKLLGIAMAGFYMIGYKFANYSTTIVTHAVSRVMFPTYSTIQEDREKLKRAYLKTLKYISMVSIPMAIGTFVIAGEFISIVLGEKWAPAIPALKILVFYGLFRSLSSNVGSVYYAIGKPEIATKFGSLQLLLSLIFIYPATLWFGLIGLCVAMTLPVILFSILHFKIVSDILDMRITTLLKLFTLPSVSSGVMFLSVYLAKGFIYATIYEFIALILVGVAIYGISLYVFTKGKIFFEIKELLVLTKKG
jgi:O-antigen/teichoic acid export membrane protein